MNGKRATLTAFVVALLTLASTAVAAEGALAEERAEDTMTIGDRVFGPDDGLVSEGGEVTVGPVRGKLALINMGGAAPEGWAYRGWAYRKYGVSTTTAFWRGSSYSKSTHTAEIKYTGRARAMGNVYTRTKRVVRASFKYVQGGSNLTSWRHSNARLRGCRWSAGSETSKVVWDSPIPWAPTTGFRYNFVYIHPAGC